MRGLWVKTWGLAVLPFARRAARLVNSSSTAGSSSAGASEAALDSDIGVSLTCRLPLGRGRPLLKPYRRGGAARAPCRQAAPAAELRRFAAVAVAPAPGACHWFEEAGDA